MGWISPLIWSRTRWDFFRTRWNRWSISRRRWMALAMLTIAGRAPDEMHAFGYSKAGSFSSVVEGALILIAAVSILWAATPQLPVAGPRWKKIGAGVVTSMASSAINFAVARRLLRRQKTPVNHPGGRCPSIFEDGWTSAASSWASLPCTAPVRIGSIQ